VAGKRAMIVGMTPDPTNLRPILLVEDDPLLVRLIELVLQRARVANTMVAAGTAAEALRHLEGPPGALPAVVLLDLGLPDMDGLALLARIRERHAAAELPVVVLSGSVTTSQMDRALVAGANRFLGKPAGIDELIGVLAAFGIGASVEVAG
jgi:DNA-binding response OmpR family regulator